MLCLFLSKRVREAQENLFSRNLGHFAGNKLWGLVGTVARARRNRFKPHAGIADGSIKLGALITVATEIEAVLKKSDGEIHFPESLNEVIAGVFAEMWIGQRVKARPELFHKAFVLYHTGMIARVPIPEIVAWPIHEEGSWR
jgi:hypothetical protein